MNAPDLHATRDALLQAARNLREAGRVDDALQMLARLERLSPRFSRLWQERGHCHVLRRETPAALAALQQAVRLNPTLPASWDMLARLHRLNGDEAEAATAARNCAMLEQLPTEVVVANCLLADGDGAMAEEVLRGFVAANPGNAGALRLLARICRERESLHEAEALAEAGALLAEALTLAPDYHEARLDYAMVLLQQQKHTAARSEAEILLAHDPESGDALRQYAAACVGLGDFEPVIDIYARLLVRPAASGSDHAELHVWRANALKVTGRLAEAIEDYRAALLARPDYGVAWFSLANLKTYRFSDDDVSRMRAACQRADLAEADRIYLSFALGKALEDRDDIAGSWRHYAEGNALRHRSVRHRPDHAEACLARATSVLTGEALAPLGAGGAPDPAPIFVVGLPRSGSTLIEQILASHPMVEGTRELTELGRLAPLSDEARRDWPMDPDALLQLGANEARALGERYLAETQNYRRLARARFTDKMPANFWHVGLIARILPQAVIIDVRREPMACCFGNLKQLFGLGHHEFSYAIEDMARHYRAYLAMMEHWDRVLPGRVLRIHHEDMIEDLEGGVRTLLAHCGLDFDPACLAFHETRRSVRTPSSEQVRQPINRAGTTRWRAYEPWLGPLRETLGDALTRYRS